MRTSLNLLLTAMLGVLPSGCGTVCNLGGGFLHPDTEPRIYGGVIRDVEIIDSSGSGSSSLPLLTETSNGKGRVLLAAAILTVAAVDPVVSFVADTLTLPITVPLQYRRIVLQRESSTPTSAGVTLDPPSPLTASSP